MKNYYEIRGDTTEIHMERYGLITLIDTFNLEKVLSLGDANWIAHISSGIKCTYAETQKNGRHKLHRFLTDCPKGMVVDHINHDTLDNRISNLRVVTALENSKNRGKFDYEWHGKLKNLLRLEEESKEPEKLSFGKIYYQKAN